MLYRPHLFDLAPPAFALFSTDSDPKHLPARQSFFHDFVIVCCFFNMTKNVQLKISFKVKGEDVKKLCDLALVALGRQDADHAT